MATITVRGMVERTRQRLHLGDKTFRPTPNVRNPAMLQEAEDFLRHMNHFKHHLGKYEKQLSGFLTTVPRTFRANLPRAWEAVEGTNMCEPAPPESTSRHPFRVGGDYDELLMADAAEIMRQRIQAIIRPLDRWSDSLDVVKTRMGRLEALRVQVDARRRRLHKRYQRTLRSLAPGTAAAIEAQEDYRAASTRRPYTPVHEGATPTFAGIWEQAGTTGATTGTAAGMGTATGGVTGTGGGVVGAGGLEGRGGRVHHHGSPPGSAVLGLESEEEYEEDFDRQKEREDSAREAVSQQRQLDAIAESYREQEQLVFEQLSGLVRDAAYFKSYVVASLLVIKDSLQATLIGLGECKRPLPGFSERESADSAGIRYGLTADLMDLITSLPPVVKAGGRRLPPGLFSPAAVAPEHIRPTRMTAQPLQVAADDVSAPEARYAPVPDVAPVVSGTPAGGAGARGLGTASGAKSFAPVTPGRHAVGLHPAGETETPTYTGDGTAEIYSTETAAAGVMEGQQLAGTRQPGGMTQLGATGMSGGGYTAPEHGYGYGSPTTTSPGTGYGGMTTPTYHNTTAGGVAKMIQGMTEQIGTRHTAVPAGQWGKGTGRI